VTGSFPFSPLAPSRLYVERRDDGSFLDAIDPEAEYWGCYATPTEARLVRRRGVAWREALESVPRLLEARLFEADEDVHVLGSAVARLSEREDRLGPAAIALGGEGWRWRDRRSRLWGEQRGDEAGWYEAAIPDLQQYEGADPGWRFVYLKYREYFECGRLVHVRYLGVEGER
jgi:hypothetical protein